MQGEADLRGTQGQRGVIGTIGEQGGRGAQREQVNRARSARRAIVGLQGEQTLDAQAIDEIIRGARRRAGIDHLTCHQLRHTCLTRLREAGMALEAVQTQAGHRSIESPRVYLHLSASASAGNASGWEVLNRTICANPAHAGLHPD